MLHKRPLKGLSSLTISIRGAKCILNQQLICSFIKRNSAHPYLLYLSCVVGVGVSVHVLICFFFFSTLLIVRLLCLWGHSDRHHSDCLLMTAVNGDLFSAAAPWKRTTCFYIISTCLVVILWCHFHFPLNTTTAREEVLLLWALRQALWYIMQSTSQVYELNFLHQRGRTERRHTFFDMTQTATFLLREAAKLSDHKIDFLNIVGTQNRTSPASSPGLEESIFIPCYYFL